MAIAPTRFSRVSIGWMTSSKSIADTDPGDTGATFSVTGPLAFTGALTQTGAAVFSSTVSVGGALTQDGAATFNAAVTAGSTVSVGGAATFTGAITGRSTLSVDGNATFTSGAFIGNAAAVNELVAVSSGTAAINLAAINPLESSSVHTFGLSGLTRGDTIIVTPDANWSLAAAHTDLAYFASSSSTAGEGNFWAINSTLTAVNAGDTVFRFTRINHPSYL